MLECIDFSSWDVYDGASEGSGRGEKIWLKASNGKIGLFKFPKTHTTHNMITTEHISEHLAYKLGEIINVPTAKVDIGTYGGRIGCMSYFICEEKEELREGIWFISAKFPKYDAEKMIDAATGTYYCLDHLLETVPEVFSTTMWIRMMLFDFLIGNRDRHQSNWAVLIKNEENKFIRLRWCPLYDNGSSLCSYIEEEKIPKLLGNDKNRFDSLVDSKSKSLIRIDGTLKKLPSHREVVQYLLAKYAATKEIANFFLKQLSPEKISELLEEYPKELLSDSKKDLIGRFLNVKCELLKALVQETEDNGKNE